MRKLAGEALGTFILVFGGCGTAVLAAKFPLVGVGLLGVAFAFGLTVLAGVYAIGPISGAHFNPVVTGVMWLQREFGTRPALLYCAFQIAGGVVGTLAAHLMFDLPVFQLGVKVRAGPAQWFAEWVATFGLLLTILLTRRWQGANVAASVALYIVAAYWFTASTSFANPAVTIARSLSDTFAGIRVVDMPSFIAAQVVGGWCGMLASRWLVGREPR
jgi:glycerol uptake facilitator-like aquaporin